MVQAWLTTIVIMLKEANCCGNDSLHSHRVIGPSFRPPTLDPEEPCLAPCDGFHKELRHAGPDAETPGTVFSHALKCVKFAPMQHS